MAKKPTKVVKLQLKAGQANPAPPVGTALGPTGIQIAEFCKQFNDRTKDQMGTVLPTVINIYEDRTFDFYTKQPPMTYLIKTELNLKSGSKLPHKDKVAHLTDAQLEQRWLISTVMTSIWQSLSLLDQHDLWVSLLISRNKNSISSRKLLWRYRLVVRTWDSHSQNRSSILRIATIINIKNHLGHWVVFT